MASSTRPNTKPPCRLTHKTINGGRSRNICRADDGALLDHPLAEPAMEGGIAVGADEHDAGTGQAQPKKKRNPDHRAQRREPPVSVGVGMGQSVLHGCLRKTVATSLE